MQMEKSMPTWSPTAMPRAVEGSFPMRETLNRPMPTPMMRMPSSITASRRGYLSFLMSFTKTTPFPRALPVPQAGFSPGIIAQPRPLRKSCPALPALSGSPF